MGNRPWKLTPPKIREDDVEAAVKTLLQLRGYYVVRLQSGLAQWIGSNNISTIGDPGIPDYVAVHARYPAIFVEVKRPGGKLRETQLTKIWEMQMGYKVAVAVVDSAAEMSAFLNTHEGKSKD